MIKKVLLSTTITLSLLSSTLYAVQSDLLADMGFDQAHSQGLTGAKQTILLFDEAPNTPHPSYEGTAFQWIENTNHVPTKRNPHGLAVRGIIQSQNGKQLGDRGLAPDATIIASDRNGQGSSFMRLLQQPGRIINCSCEMSFNDIDIHQVKEAIIKNDCIIVIAAGNFGEFLSKNPEADWLLDPEVRDHVLLVGNALSVKKPKIKKNFFRHEKKETKIEHQLCKDYFVDFIQKNYFRDHYENFFKFIHLSGLPSQDLRNLFATINDLLQNIDLKWQDLSDVNYHKMINARSDKKTGGTGIFGMFTAFDKSIMAMDDLKSARDELYKKIISNLKALDALKSIASLFQKSKLDTTSLLINLAQEINLAYVKGHKSYYFMDPFSNKKGISPFPMICALGYNIQHPILDFDYGTSKLQATFEKGSDTSFAAPIISSALALALQVNSNITAKQLIKCLLRTAYKSSIDSAHHFDAGILNLSAFLQDVQKYQTQNTQLKYVSNMSLTSLQNAHQAS